MKNIKGYIISFVLGAIIFSGVTVFASTLLSKDIAFTPTKEDWQVSTVEEAINDLYDYSREDTINKLDFTTTTSESYGSVLTNRNTTLTVEPGNYIIVANQSTATFESAIKAEKSGGSPDLTYSTGECRALKNKGTNASGTTKYQNYYINTQLAEGIWQCSFTETTTLSFTTKYTTVDKTNAGQIISAYALKLN